MAGKRLVVGLTGATGAVYGVRLLQALHELGVETHVVVSKWAQLTIAHETEWRLPQLRQLASKWYAPGDMGAAISSGSFRTDGMAIVPCSVGSLGAIATGAHQHLIHRAADVTLKERRPLLLVVRETPLSALHLENMLKLARLGVSILPPVPAFYMRPRTIEDLVDHLVARVLDHFGLDAPFAQRWDGRLEPAGTRRRVARQAVAALEAEGTVARRAGRRSRPKVK